MSKLHSFLLLPYKTPLVIRVEDPPPQEKLNKDGNGMSPVKRVECYSGYTLHERPRVIHLEDRKLSVIQVKDRWFGPDHNYFKVLADDGKTYLLRYDREADQWAMEILPAGA